MFGSIFFFISFKKSLLTNNRNLKNHPKEKLIKNLNNDLQLWDNLKSDLIFRQRIFSFGTRFLIVQSCKFGKTESFIKSIKNAGELFPK